MSRRPDDEVQFLYTKTSPKGKERVHCEMAGCLKDLTSMSLSERQHHYESHFSDKPEASTSSDHTHGGKSTMTWPKLPRWNSRSDCPPEENVFWQPAQTQPPPNNFSPGLVPIIKKALIKSHAKGQTQRAWLCFESAVHIQGEPFDRRWGCGYRNFLMACTALMSQPVQPVYFPLLDDPMPPGVRHLQATIQEAWSKGYDEEGAEQLKHDLLGTNKWIGTADLYVAFTYRGIPSRLADFDLSNKGVEVLLDWVERYFSSGESSQKHTNAFDALRGSNAVVMSNKMPLILQHSGHSRTIIGLERCKDNIANLLVFDPTNLIPRGLRKAGIANLTAVAGRASSKPSSKVQQVLHPIKTIKAHKRKASQSSETTSPKRIRAGMSIPGSPDHAIVISDDEDVDGGGEELPQDFANSLKLFRLGVTKLRRKDKYQILYFPLEDPLTESDRWQRRVVTSEIHK